MTLSITRGLELIRQYGGAERWLAVLVTQRPDGTPSVSVVNSGVLPHPLTGLPTVALVARGRTAKLTNLRATPRATLVFRAGWEWIAVTGTTELAGPHDPLPGLHATALRYLMRDIYTAAGGRHPDLSVYDAEMTADERTAVLLDPRQFSTNPPGTEHQEPV